MMLTKQPFIKALSSLRTRENILSSRGKKVREKSV